jgi:hypothetical protein
MAEGAQGRPTRRGCLAYHLLPIADDTVAALASAEKAYTADGDAAAYQALKARLEAELQQLEEDRVLLQAYVDVVCNGSNAPVVSKGVQYWPQSELSDPAEGPVVERYVVRVNRGDHQFFLTTTDPAKPRKTAILIRAGVPAGGTSAPRSSALTRATCGATSASCLPAGWGT